MLIAGLLLSLQPYACSSQELPPPPAGGGPGGAADGTGAGGSQGPKGAGGGGVSIGLGGSSGGAGGIGGEGPTGQGGSSGCIGAPDACVSTCLTTFPDSSGGFCDATGVFECPAGYTRLSSCPPRACVRGTGCCDDTTGMIAYPPCDADGLLPECPAGSHDTSAGECIPMSSGVSSCSNLRGQACNLMDQRCDSADWVCNCTSGGDGGLTWSCYFGLPPG